MGGMDADRCNATSEPFTVNKGDDILIHMPLKQDPEKRFMPKVKLRLKLYLFVKRKGRVMRKEICIDQPVLIGKKIAITQKFQSCRKRKRRKKEMRGKMKVKLKIE